MNKELKFSMIFDMDTSIFDRAIGHMQKKLAEVTKGPGGTGGQTTGQDPMMQKPAMEAFFKSIQALRTNMNTAMQKHAQDQMKLMKDIAKEEGNRGKLLQDQERISKNKNKDLQEELRIKKELEGVESRISKLQNTAGASKTSFQAATAAAQGQTVPVFVTNWPSGGGGGGGGGGQPSPGNAAGGFWGGLGKSLGTAAAVLATGAALIDQYTSLPLTRTSALGNATQSIIGNHLEEMSRGDVVSGMAWQKERQRALDMAGSKLNSQMITGPMNVLGGAVGLVKGSLTGEGAGQNKDANMLVGSIAKAIEMTFSVGGLVPNKISSAYGKEAEKYFSTQQAQLMEDFGQNYEKMVQAQQRQNPLKNLAVGYYQDRYKTDLQSQRMMGLNDTQLYGRGGFLEQANTSGFTGDMAQQMAQQIQGAGGSTRGMKNSTLGLRAQRGFDLTNAGSVLGTISSGAGSQEASERIFKKILEEGVKNGLDKSEAVEELRRFSQQTAEVVAKTGAVTGEDTQRILENFMRFQAAGVPTMKEQEGAQSAYKQYQQFSGESSGRGGAMQFASLMKRGMGSLGFRAMAGLMEMPEEDVTETNERVVAAAVKLGKSPKEMVEMILGAKQEKADVESGFNPKWRELLKKRGISGKLSLEQQKQLSAGTKEDRETLEAYYQTVQAPVARYDYTTSQAAEAATRGFERGGATSGPQTEADRMAARHAKFRLEQGVGGRAGDETISAAGAASQAMLENFREFKTEITPAANALDAFTKKMVIFTQVLQGTPEKDRAAAASAARERLFPHAPTQPQAGKPKPGGG